jgi:hypothetical protein
VVVVLQRKNRGSYSMCHKGIACRFPRGTQNSRYNDCFARQIWNNVITIKMEMTKLLGRYYQQQGLYRKEHCCLSNVTPETLGLLKQQFGNLVGNSLGCAGLSSRNRVYRVSESDLVVRAAWIRGAAPYCALRPRHILDNFAKCLESQSQLASDVNFQK